MVHSVRSLLKNSPPLVKAQTEYGRQPKLVLKPNVPPASGSPAVVLRAASRKVCQDQALGAKA